MPYTDIRGTRHCVVSGSSELGRVKGLSVRSLNPCAHILWCVKYIALNQRT